MENDTAVAMFILSFLFNLFSELLPSSPPQVSEPWEEIMKDVEDKIMVGMTHWQHPRFHAYFPAGNSFPSILADMLSGAIGCVGFSWVDKKNFFWFWW